MSSIQLEEEQAPRRPAPAPLEVKVHQVEQRSLAWHRLHVGRLTGSMAKDAVTVPKRKGFDELEGRRKLRRRFVAEKLTGTYTSGTDVTTGPMARGIELEPKAIEAYEVETGLLVSSVGFVELVGVPAGCSPDGIVGDVEGGVFVNRDELGILEIKSPNTDTHLGYLQALLAGQVPPEYLEQVRHNLWVTGAAWCDFVSFDDRFPDGMRFARVRVTRDDANLAEYEDLAMEFLATVERDFNAAIAASVGAD